MEAHRHERGEGVGRQEGWLPALDRKPEPTIFADGFESGNTSAWSSAVP
jgi:hypothetical protein